MWRSIVAVATSVVTLGAICGIRLGGPIHHEPTFNASAYRLQQPQRELNVDPDALRIARLAFEERLAIGRVMSIEGGYANQKADPGGPTAFGITRVTARRHGFRGSLRDMTPAQAFAVYRILWVESGADDIVDAGMRFQYFDAWVAHGPTAARKWLAMLNGDWSEQGCVLFNKSRLRAYRESPLWKSFGKGWSARIALDTEACAA